MPDAPRHFRIFISSPGDVAEEREIALKLIDELPYDPSWRGRVTLEAVAWDKKGAPLLATITPQEAVNKGLPLPSHCDIVVVIFWSKMGTPLPFPEYRKEKGEPYLSGTDWEYEDAFKSAKATGYPEVIVYRRTEVPILLPTDPEIMKKIDQWQKVQTFFGSFSEEGTGAGLGGYNSYPKTADFKDLLETHLKNVLERLLKSPPRPTTPTKTETKPVDQPPAWQGSPFPGLRAFTTADEAIYFGRGRESGELMKRVAKQGFVAVVGASGSGKSSLVGAGLIPRLKAGGLEGSETWLLPEYKDGQWVGLRFTPGEVGDNPFMALAVKCTALHGTKNPQFADKLKADPKVLVQLCLKALKGKPDTAKALIFIDQFEELFTVVAADYREPFINMLAETAAHDRLRVVITTRSDFYDRCVEWQALTDLLRDGSFPVSTPDAFFLKDMIELPAERAGLTFEAGLAAQMVRDTGSDSGALALLAFALDELYKAGNLTHQAYKDLGKVEGAIGTRAAAIYGELAADVQAALPQVFGQLVTVSLEGTPTRHRASLGNFDAALPAGQLISALVEARLLVADAKTVEVAHEALFRKWSTLVEWIAEYKTDLYAIEQVKQAAKEWATNEKRKSYLWSHDRLIPVYTAQKRLTTQFDSLTLDFIQPEAQRLLQQFQTATEATRLALIENDFARLSEDGLDALVSALVLTIDINNLTRMHSLSYEYWQNKFQLLGSKVFSNSRMKSSEILIKRLTQIDFRERIVAVDALGKLNALEAIPNLIALLSDVDKRVQLSVVEALGRLNAQDAIPNLIALLSDSDESTRWTAVEALGRLNAQKAIPNLIALLSDSDAKVRLAAVAALGKLNAQVAIPNLIVALSDGDDSVRQWAVITLGDLNAQEAIPNLIRALSDSSMFVRGRAATALGNLNVQEAISNLIMALSDDESFVRLTVIEALGKLNAQKAIPNLIALLSDTKYGMATMAAKALEHIGTPEALAAVAAWWAKNPPL